MIKFWHKHLLLPRSLALAPYTGRPLGLPTRLTGTRQRAEPEDLGLKACLRMNPRNPFTVPTAELALFPKNKPGKSQVEPHSQGCSPCTRNAFEILMWTGA